MALENKQAIGVALAALSLILTSCANTEGPEVQARQDELYLSSGQTVQNRTTEPIELRQSLVRVTGKAGCSGVLIAPDIVLTAAHCVMELLPVGGWAACNNCGTPNGYDCIPCTDPACRAGVTSCAVDNAYKLTGDWETLDADEATLTSSFGLNSASWLTSINSRNVALPPFVGDDVQSQGFDIALIGLPGGGVDPSIATPRNVAVNTSPLPSDRFWVDGWGGTGVNCSNGTIPATAQWGVFDSFRIHGDAGPTTNVLALDGVPAGFPQAYGCGGDSGAPVIDASTGSVVGINASGTARWRHVASPDNFNTLDALINGPRFGTSPDSNYPALADWIGGHRKSFCAATQPNTAQGAGWLVKLARWWSSERQENYTSTLPYWNGCFPGFDRQEDPQYRYDKLEGWIISPSLALSGSSSFRDIWECWSPTREDNMAMESTSSSGGPPTPPPGYSCFRRLGFAWTSWASGRLPLRQWYSPSREEHILIAGYTSYYSEGYFISHNFGYVPGPGEYDQQM